MTSKTHSSTLFLFVLLLLPSFCFSQGAIVNEFSNGTTGSEEYVELVVIGPAGNENCGPVDLRGFIIDDNNGEFSGGASTGEGIAAGHARFASTGPWGSVPTGSIILIYNNGAKNPAITLPDDPTDANGDGVYILPISDPGIESCSSIPNTSDSSYGGCTYGAGVWNRVGLRNSGDAAQVRTAIGAFFHGVAYGSAPLNGGPLGLMISGSGSGQVFSFDNSASNDYEDVANYSRAAAATAGNQTPGTMNNTANGSWITGLGNGCTLPVTYSQELRAYPMQEAVGLSWETIAETNNQRFEIERSDEAGGDFRKVGSIDGNGASAGKKSYEFVDDNPLNGTAYYRLRQVDFDGAFSYSRIAEVSTQMGLLSEPSLFPQPAADFVRFELSAYESFEYKIINLMGQTLRQGQLANPEGACSIRIDLQDLQAGYYLYQIESKSSSFQGKLVVQ